MVFFKYGKNKGIRKKSKFTSHEYFQEGRFRRREIKNSILTSSFGELELRNKMKVQCYGEDEIILSWSYYSADQKLVQKKHLISFNHMFFSFKPEDGYTGATSFTYYTKIENGDLIEQNLHIEVFHDYNYLKLSNHKKIDLRKAAHDTDLNIPFFDIFTTEGTGFNWQAMNKENKYIQIETEQFTKHPYFEKNQNWIKFLVKNEHLKTEEKYDYTLAVTWNLVDDKNTISIYGPLSDEAVFKFKTQLNIKDISFTTNGGTDPIFEILIIDTEWKVYFISSTYKHPGDAFYLYEKTIDMQSQKPLFMNRATIMPNPSNSKVITFIGQREKDGIDDKASISLFRFYSYQENH